MTRGIEERFHRPRVVAVIQARMGSRRLPGKALRRIGGHTVLHHVVHRLRQVPVLDMITVATTRRPEDDRIVEECRRFDVLCLRGPEDDVLRRYLQAADHCRADIVVRATADNPAIDPGSVQRAVMALKAGRLDYVCEQGLPKGCCGEVFTYPALWRTASFLLLPKFREHVTLAMKECKGLFKIEYPEAPVGLRRPELNLSIDTEEDYQFVRSLMERCSLDVLNTSLAEILAEIPAEPGICGEDRELEPLVVKG